MLEGILKKDKYKEWPERRSLLGRYIPWCEPRFIPEGAVIHQSVLERMKAREDYKPVNMPKTYKTFDMPTEPEPHEAAG